MNQPLPESLESRVSRWLRTPPLKRTECPSCGRWAGTQLTLHSWGCYVLSAIRKGYDS